MKPEQRMYKKGFARMATVDLTTMALLAGLGMATKSIVYPVASMITGPLYIPAGSVAGGIYMMWLVMARGIVGKHGAATLTTLVQAIISFLSPFGRFGILSLIIYVGPGLATDIFFLSSRHKACCISCCFGASALANAVGSILVGTLVLALPLLPLLFISIVAAISGGVGGFVANTFLVECRKLGLGGV